jgi:uncharacterized protein YciI
MYALAIIRYRRPLEVVIAATDEHRAYLRELRSQGILLASGPFDPRTGGALLLRVPDDDVQGALDRVRDGDPVHADGDRAVRAAAVGARDRDRGAGPAVERQPQISRTTQRE